eukprot:3303519-Pleurochrysis_carterae.AAC.1
MRVRACSYACASAYVWGPPCACACAHACARAYACAHFRASVCEVACSHAQARPRRWSTRVQEPRRAFVWTTSFFASSSKISMFSFEPFGLASPHDEVYAIVLAICAEESAMHCRMTNWSCCEYAAKRAHEYSRKDTEQHPQPNVRARVHTAIR